MWKERNQMPASPERVGGRQKQQQEQKQEKNKTDAAARTATQKAKEINSKIPKGFKKG